MGNQTELRCEKLSDSVVPMGTMEGIPECFPTHPMGSPGVHIHGAFGKRPKAAGVVFGANSSGFSVSALKKLK